MRHWVWITFCALSASCASRHVPAAIQPIALEGESTQSARTLIVVRTSGHGGYGPGRITLRRARTLSAGEWSRIEAKLAAANFDRLPTRAEGGFDGAQWIIESMRGGQYRLVDRWSPERDGPDAAFRAACEYFIALAGTDVVTGNVY